MSRKYTDAEYRNIKRREREVIQQMLDELSSEAKVLNRMNRLAQSVHELEEQLEHKPSIEEVSAYLDLTTEEIQNLLKIGGEKLTIEDI